MDSLADRLDGLADQQVLLLLDSLAAELAADDTPEGAVRQAEALQCLFDEQGESVDVSAAAAGDASTAAQAARRILVVIGQVPELRPRVEEWLDDPPTQEAAAIPLLLAAPVVLTACVAVLQLIGHIKFRRDRSGHWDVSYDPSSRTPFDSTVKEMVTVLAKLVSGMS